MKRAGLAWAEGLRKTHSTEGRRVKATAGHRVRFREIRSLEPLLLASPYGAGGGIKAESLLGGVGSD